jgi:hypothetical protein
MSYVPVSIDLARAQVELLELGSATFEEPFFRDTVERTRRERLGGVPLIVDLPTFVLQANRYPAPPDVLIFHVGRCGSTLLTNMLVRGGDYLAVKEPEMLNELVAAWLASSDELRQKIALVTGAAVRILLGAIDSPRRRILKLAAWNVQMATALLEMFHTTRAAFVFRSPAETVASQLHTRPDWFHIINAPRRTQARYFPSIAEIPDGRSVSPAALFAHAWRSAVEAALSVPAGRLIFIGYDALVDESAATLGLLLDHWGRLHDENVLVGMLSALSIYSKDPKGSEQFDPLGLHCRPSLSMSQRLEVDAIAGDLWRELQSVH